MDETLVNAPRISRYLPLKPSPLLFAYTDKKEKKIFLRTSVANCANWPGMSPTPRNRITWSKFLTKLTNYESRYRSRFFFHWKWKIRSLEMGFGTDRNWTMYRSWFLPSVDRKIPIFNPFDQMWGIRSASASRLTCMCWCPPLFLIYEEMREYSAIYEEAVSHVWLCNSSRLDFLIYWGKFCFLFLSVYITLIRTKLVLRRLSSLSPMLRMMQTLLVTVSTMTRTMMTHWTGWLMKWTSPGDPSASSTSSVGVPGAASAGLAQSSLSGGLWRG
jgi:hypothetical protein